MKTPSLRKTLKNITASHIIAGSAGLVAVGIGWCIALMNWRQTLDGMLGDSRALLLGVAYGVGAPLVALLALVEGIGWLRDPKSHPALDRPEAGSPEEVVAAIDRELQAPEGVMKVGPALFTHTWIVRMDDWSADTALISSIVWVYKHFTHHKTYGLTVSKTCTVKIRTRSDQSFQMGDVPEKQADALLEHLAARVPWALVGYNEELDEQWKTDRDAIIALVDERRAAVATARGDHLRQPGVPAAPAG